MSKEIGSEFWANELILNIKQNICDNQAILLSGRTALDFVCRDSQITHIMLPAYCCHTMIEPFIRNDIKVSFYSVRFDGTPINFVQECDAVLVIDYFGYVHKEMLDLAKQVSQQGKIVIYDGTHRLNGNLCVEQYADYSICSYRKWFYCDYAIVRKHRGKFIIPLPQNMNTSYINLRNQATELKRRYMETANGNKDVYLSLFAEAEELLGRDYAGYLGTPVLFDYIQISTKRRENAKLLYNELCSILDIQFLENGVADGDVPLCVPILLKDSEIRDQLRKYLITRSIYCPIHWPLSKLHLIEDDDKELYHKELSLVCDQRYDVDDMYREIIEIKNFLKG